MIHADLLWMISDFPAYAVLLGWRTKGELSCPHCNEHDMCWWLQKVAKHYYMGNVHFLHGDSGPQPLIGAEVIEKIERIFGDLIFGKKSVTKKI